MFNTTAGRDDHDKIVINSPFSLDNAPCEYEPKSFYDELSTDGVEINLGVEKVENPDHYKQVVSPYDVAKSMYGAEGLLKFVTVNAIKYIQRFPHKFKDDPKKQLDDLIKAKRSLETAIELHKEIHRDLHIRHG